MQKPKVAISPAQDNSRPSTSLSFNSNPPEYADELVGELFDGLLGFIFVWLWHVVVVPKFAAKCALSNKAGCPIGGNHKSLTSELQCHNFYVMRMSSSCGANKHHAPPLTP